MRVSALWRVCAAVAAVAVVTASGAYAEGAPMTDREKEMMMTIEALKERLADLESKVNSMSAAPAASPDVEQRLAEVEKTLEEKAEASAKDFRVYWKDSLRFETADGNVKLRIGGSIQSDWAWFDQDRDLEFIWDPAKFAPKFVDVEDGTEFRNARLLLEGEVYENIGFKAQYDFVDGDADFKDVYVEMRKVPVAGNVRVGQFYEPFNMDELTSSNDIMFMERALPAIFAPQRKPGLMIHDTALDERVYWAVGVFRPGNDYGVGGDDGEYNYTARVTGLPWYRDEGKQLVHLGVAYSYRNPEDRIEFKGRPESHLVPSGFTNTGSFFTEELQLMGLEAAAIYGPLTLQSEYITAAADTVLLGNRDFSGWYAQASYMLTGEHHTYKKQGGVIGAPKIKNNFSLGEERGWGAWEVALRYSTLDLNDGFIRGGQEDNWTAGLNWYLNPNTKVKLEYIWANVDHDLYDGDLGILQTRFQFAF